MWPSQSISGCYFSLWRFMLKCCRFTWHTRGLESDCNTCKVPTRTECSTNVRKSASNPQREGKKVFLCGSQHWWPDNSDQYWSNYDGSYRGATGGECLLPPSRPHLLSNWERVLVFIGANTEHQEITDLLQNVTCRGNYKTSCTSNEIKDISNFWQLSVGWDPITLEISFKN